MLQGEGPHPLLWGKPDAPTALHAISAEFSNNAELDAQAASTTQNDCLRGRDALHQVDDGLITSMGAHQPTHRNQTSSTVLQHRCNNTIMFTIVE